MMTCAFIVPVERLGDVIAWMERRSSPEQASTINVQSRVVAIECTSSRATDHIATRVGDRPGWHRNEDVWLFPEVLEPGLDIEAEFQLAQDIVGDCGISDECEVAECRVLEVGFPSEDEKHKFQAGAEFGDFSS